MNGPFRLEKWYFDLLTPQQDFIFLYLAWLRFLGMARGQLNIHILSSHEEATALSFPIHVKEESRDGEKRSLVFEYGKIEISPEQGNVVLQVPGLTATLSYRACPVQNFSAAALRIVKKKSQIWWYPLQLQSRVSGKISSGERSWEPTAAPGYCDYLSTAGLGPPWALRHLMWGRLHQGSLALTYAFVQEQHPGKTWPHLLLSLAGKYRVMDDFAIRCTEYALSETLAIRFPRSYVIVGEQAGVKINLAVKHIRMLVETPFLDSPTPGKRLPKDLSRWIPLQPKGIKFLSLGSGEISWDGQPQQLGETVFIDEYVIF